MKKPIALLLSVMTILFLFSTIAKAVQSRAMNGEATSMPNSYTVVADTMNRTTLPYTPMEDTAEIVTNPPGVTAIYDETIGTTLPQKTMEDDSIIVNAETTIHNDCSTTVTRVETTSKETNNDTVYLANFIENFLKGSVIVFFRIIKILNYTIMITIAKAA